MKTNNTKALIWTLLLPLVSFCDSHTVWADAPSTAAKADAGRSVFTIPAGPKEGCDPFFPNSSRPFESTTPAAKPGVEAVSLVFRGISGSAAHPFAIINNHTVGEGDEGDVLTEMGRVHLRCIEIKRNSVLIEYGGQRHELVFTGK